MKRLRHPVRAIREPFGTAGVVIAVVALVAAIGGTALAATKLNGTQKKEVEKIAKKFQGTGPAGPQGPAGTNGTSGSKGDTGAKGDKGIQGIQGNPGSPGTAGTDGHSPEVIAEYTSSDPQCNHNGGVKYEVEGSGEPPALVCNGKEGKDGSPWSAGGTLPASTTPGCPEQEIFEPHYKGCTETGAWTVSGTTGDTNGLFVSISFPIPLETRLEEGEVHYIKQVNSAACPGSVALPLAAPGQLCVYQANNGNEPQGTAFVAIEMIAIEGEKGADRSGAMLHFGPPTGVAFGGGTFAVTAP